MRRAYASALVAAFFCARFASSAAAADMTYRTDTGPGPADFSGFNLGIDAAAALGSVGGANLSGPGAPAADFRIDDAATHGVPGLINLFGIDSPGLTASLALASEAVSRID